ncbi:MULTISPECIES: monovalent cation/H(+) antiporter subunit G [Isoptericola]|uniref:Monovalent cation/H(+) antiporter subunit G n=1 Tax=Isoptericola sediminis TaxID=2733572 RepID=A0A849KFU2_9MICO|nr:MULTISPECIES: monovalent cation/H(+) antiporter subunit G [Isoptericola]MDO8143497.1 monovalent cation/H(+) antiporter subunit G [Isoptericola sp. 178]MDO8147362.1 monovalent cation/H(+) antiporter subunit G [Isoptericola sp. b515]MDO8150327.1 monovalent cation/H(+) antiporter subunit G [Isoptericola sp. b408]NNU27423.1 monovalent cation/H(+) antiporter subunit G [Isoptericola sediminis]
MTEVDPGFWTTLADVVAGVSLLAGAFLTLAAAVGAVRFDSLLGRMHAVTKPQVLGLILLLLGLALRVRSWSAVTMLALVVVFQLATAPVAAHLVSRAGFRTGKIDEDALVPNEMEHDAAAAPPDRD